MTDSPPPQEMPAESTAPTVPPAAPPAESPPAKGPRRWPSALFGVLVGIVLVSAGVWLGSARTAGRDPPSIRAIETQLANASVERDLLRRELAQTNERALAAARAAAEPGGIAGLPQVLAQIQKTIADLAWQVETRAAAPPGIEPAAVTALERRLAAIEAAATAPGATADATARAAAEALATRLTDAERALAELRGAQPNAAAATDAMMRQIAALQARIDEVVRAARNADPGAGSGATIVAATQLRERMRGAGPFAAELAAFRAVLGRPGDNAVVAILDSITPLAATGAPTATELARDLDHAVAAAQSESPPEAQGWTDAVLRGVRNLVRVRRTGDTTDDVGRIERAHALLQGGDVAGAVALVEQTTPPLRAALAGWMADARARLTLDQAGTAIAARAVALAAGAGPVAP